MEKHILLITTLIAMVSLVATLPAFAADEQKVVNVNEADASQLALLPRVGPALAGRIIEFREANGKLENAEDLILVRGIGEKTFTLLEPFVAVSGETTLKEKIKVSDLQRQQEQQAEKRSDG
ncbi:MAG: helix-hairpin-helix domain-containing protein [Thermoanaerobaculia bacterium]